MMVQVHPKPRDYLFVAGQRRRTQIMGTWAKVRMAIVADHSLEARHSLADIAKETVTTSLNVSSRRTKKSGATHINRKVTSKGKILLMLLVMIVSMMLLLLLDVLRPMVSGYWTLDVLFICVRIEIDLLLLILLLLVLF